MPVSDIGLAFPQPITTELTQLNGALGVWHSLGRKCGLSMNQSPMWLASQLAWHSIGNLGCWVERVDQTAVL